MHYEVSYKGQNSDRKALLDLVEWFGFKKSLLVFRSIRQIRDWWKHWEGRGDEAKAKLFQTLNGHAFAIEMGGVSGEPVRALLRKYLGEDLVKEWIAS